MPKRDADLVNLMCAMCCCVISFQSAATTAQTLPGFDEDSATRAARVSELNWLEHEIGSFAVGRETVFSGEITITQKDRDKITTAQGKAIASLSLEASPTLTIVLPERQQWLQLTQADDESTLTNVSRLRPLHATFGTTATCDDCITPFKNLRDDTHLIRLSAKGNSFDITRSPFAIEISGYLELSPASMLSLDQVLALRPDLDSFLRRPKNPFVKRGREYIRDVSNVLIKRAPPLGADPVRFTCNHETSYKARHHVSADTLARFEVRNLTLGETQLCCVDNARHDGSKVCGKELNH